MADQNKTEIIYRPTTTNQKNIKLDTEIKSRPINFNLYAIVFCVNIVSFAAGNACGWSSTALIDLKSNNTQNNPLGRSITSLEESWIVSLVNLGAAVGTLFAGYGSNKFGKKNTILIFGTLMFVSNIILTFANTVALILVARFLVGLGFGCGISIIPIYVAEISETHIRGLLVSVIGILFSAGLIAVFSVGALVNLKTLNFLLIVPPGIFLFFFKVYCPESPYYYLIDGDVASAKRSLKKLRNNDSNSIEQEIYDIEAFIRESNIDESLWKAIKSRKFRRAIIITIVLMFFQQFIGSTIILSYLETILSIADGLISSSISSILISISTFLSVVLCTIFVDRWGRKILLVIGCIGCGLALISLGIFFYLQNVGIEMTHVSWIPLVSLIAYTITLGFGLGCIPSILAGELFSDKTKATASSIVNFISLILGFVTTLIFPTLNNLIGVHGSFWFFAGNAVLALIFVIRYVPETNGKTFQEILRIMEK